MYFYRLLLVGGCETDEDGVSKAAGCGISAWRVLSGSPYYKQVTSYEDDIRTASMLPYFIAWILSLAELSNWKFNMKHFLKEELNAIFWYFVSCDLNF